MFGTCLNGTAQLAGEVPSREWCNYCQGRIGNSLGAIPDPGQSLGQERNPENSQPAFLNCSGRHLHVGSIKESVEFQANFQTFKLFLLYLQSSLCSSTQPVHTPHGIFTKNCILLTTLPASFSLVCPKIKLLGCVLESVLASCCDGRNAQCSWSSGKPV